MPRCGAQRCTAGVLRSDHAAGSDAPPPDCRCSWLSHPPPPATPSPARPQALQRASEAQRAVIEQHYGKDDEAAVAAVKAVYNELQLEQLFK